MATSELLSRAWSSLSRRHGRVATAKAGVMGLRLLWCVDVEDTWDLWNL